MSSNEQQTSFPVMAGQGDPRHRERPETSKERRVERAEPRTWHEALIPFPGNKSCASDYGYAASPAGCSYELAERDLRVVMQYVARQHAY